MRKKINEDQIAEANASLTELLGNRRVPREHKESSIVKATRFTIEFRDENKKVTSKWSYDLKKFANGPILVENLEKRLKSQKNNPGISETN